VLLGSPLTFSITFINEFKPKSGPGPIDDTSFPEASAASSREVKSGSSVNKQNGADSSQLRHLPKDPMVLPRNSFKATHLYSSLRSNARFDAMRLGQQEDAEEFLGFFLDGLHEEFRRLLNLLGDTGSNATLLQQGDDRPDSLDNDNVSMHEDDEWQEVGKRNRAVVTRTVRNFDCTLNTTLI
jgi:ubiquitin carboxyl-terminal hydrolase 10